MTALAWLALAVGVALVPLPSPAWQRALGLSRRGRLATVAGPRARRTRWPTFVLATFSRRHREGRRHELLTATRLLVAELVAGGRPAAALAAAAEVAPHHASAFAAASAAAAAGADPAVVLLAAGDLEPLAHAWRVAAVSGAPMADVLARVAADLADLEQQHRAVAVALAGPRSSAALLAGLPVIGIALGGAMGAKPLSFLLGTPPGRLLCGAGVLLDALGVIWTQRLMRRAQRA
ncbi:MAG: type II secretion system F family protein [Pseudonocardiales bacterium]